MWRAALGASGSATIHQKLNDCLARCRHPPGGQRSELRPWAFDIEGLCGKANPKTYLACSLESFTGAYRSLPELRRHAYEVLLPEVPCHAYFDLEFSTADGLNAHADGDVLTFLVLNTLRKTTPPETTVRPGGLLMAAAARTKLHFVPLVRPVPQR